MNWDMMFKLTNLDSPKKWTLNFQDAASIHTEELQYFHDNVMIMIVMMLGLVGWLLMTTIMNKQYNKNLTDHATLEFMWTCIPAFMLIIMAMPSLKLLYLMDEVIMPYLTIKVTGHQWYWNYEYPQELGGYEHDSYMTPTSDLKSGENSLLEVDNPLFMPNNTPMSVVVSGADVMHSFAMPSLGIKVDAIPGSLNQGFFTCKSIGIYYGQCSEICGSDHSFMPMCVKTLPLSKFIDLANSWVDLE